MGLNPSDMHRFFCGWQAAPYTYTQVQISGDHTLQKVFRTGLHYYYDHYYYRWRSIPMSITTPYLFLCMDMRKPFLINVAFPTLMVPRMQKWFFYISNLLVRHRYIYSTMRSKPVAPPVHHCHPALQAVTIFRAQKPVVTETIVLVAFLTPTPWWAGKPLVFIQPFSFTHYILSLYLCI